MQDYTTAESGKSVTTTDCGPHRDTTSGPKEVRSGSKRRAHNKLDLSTLAGRARALKVDGLTIYPETVRARGAGYFYLMTECQSCGKRLEKELRNMEKGFSSKCKCRRAGERAGYGLPSHLTQTLGSRYNAMMQRCYKTTHVSSQDYKGRGIKVLFESRRDFVMWVVAKWPEETFKGKDFDRRDNDGDYSKENLRLVTRSVNLLNRRRSGSPDVAMGREFLIRHPQVTYTAKTILGLLKQGFSEQEILKRWGASERAGWRKPTTS